MEATTEQKKEIATLSTPTSKSTTIAKQVITKTMEISTQQVIYS